MYSQLELKIELFRICRELTETHETLEIAIRDWVYKENEYRKRKATVYLASEGTIDARKAIVDAACESERLAAHWAAAHKEATLEKIRSLRAQLSALETLNSSGQTDIETRTEPVKWDNSAPF